MAITTVSSNVHISRGVIVKNRSRSNSFAGFQPAKSICAKGKSVFSFRRTTQKVYATSSMDDQQKQMDAAEKRWKQNLRSGRVRSVSTRELMDMMESEEWTVLDVRPQEEVEKGAQASSVKVPLFVVDDDISVPALLKQMSAFGMGGWWLGGQHMKANPTFVTEVVSRVPMESSKVIIVCQKGLRSLAACEQLARAGYQDIAWLNGGYEAAEKGIIETVDGKDIRLAGVGGLSGVIGWNPLLQEEGGSTMDGPFGNLIKVVAFLVVLDLIAFAYEFSQSQP
mmetsp:Transcript_23366/g.32284  ORF Transcript_23366/g.32284 Transcript_23366/m.32284 type:complete len:281 (+) Transcript_23366:101-943(+)|eukprot:CAMPEP_0196584548 /NCGR_PEP_ID=MMETSP1081-20130531/47521_1 /TAXON_ID=36882 /ORGANISM="Pyramimonas amylifera, Strain CCMP720" /LENGTH=280 /DNA_ID=CAMNT_0041905785 /DNA_START=92 /DNA_END=934 /DNA_ORIENTATION=+